MSVLELTEENFDKEVLSSNKTVLVDFYADWCGPCRMMSPVIDEIAEELSETLKVGKVNVDDNNNLAIKYQIMTIPTMVIIKDGNPVKTFIGVTDKSNIINYLNNM